jgi:hypothetical protein
MNRDDIIRITKEAGFTQWCPGWYLSTDDLERFAKIIAAAEREACARVVENMVRAADGMECVAAIRARGNNENPLCS